MVHHERYMRMALEQAVEAAQAGEVPVGCVIVLGDRVVAAAHNMSRALKDPTAHAEILALRAAAKRTGDWRLTGATVYVTSEPCIMCAGALVLARVQRVVYALEDEKFGAAVSLYEIPEDPRLNHRVKVEKGPLGEEVKALLRAFFEDKRSG